MLSVYSSPFLLLLSWCDLLILTSITILFKDIVLLLYTAICMENCGVDKIILSTQQCGYDSSFCSAAA